LQGLRIYTNNKVNAKYSDETNFSDVEFKQMISLTKAQFNDLYGYCDLVSMQNGVRYISKRHLITFLCKLRQGISDEMLKVIFQYSTRQSASLAINLVRKSLRARFILENIGFAAIDRNTYIQRHVTSFANHLYNPEPDDPKAIVAVDGTYTKVEKSSNFRVLHQTYCKHKGYHLLKPALLVAPDGYILAIYGPYFSDARNNDAAMLLREFDNDVQGMRAWFQQDDIVLVDRGYRDTTDFLEGIDIRYKMSALLQQGQCQLTTEEANESRLVTKSRWINEACNGHIKSIFKFFDHTVPFAHIMNLRDYYLIAGALINKYRERILMQGADAQLAQLILQRAQKINVLRARVEVDNLLRRGGEWVHLDENQVQDFPWLDLQYLRDICLGVYQVNLTPGYIQDKLEKEGPVWPKSRGTKSNKG